MKAVAWIGSGGVNKRRNDDQGLTQNYDSAFCGTYETDRLLGQKWWVWPSECYSWCPKSGPDATFSGLKSFRAGL